MNGSILHPTTSPFAKIAQYVLPPRQPKKGNIFLSSSVSFGSERNEDSRKIKSFPQISFSFLTLFNSFRFSSEDNDCDQKR